MKNIFATLILLPTLILPAMAQVNPDDVVKKDEDQIFRENLENAFKGLFKFKYLPIPKTRTLSAVEKSQVEHLKCIDEMLNKTKGGIDSVANSYNELLKVVTEEGQLSTDRQLLTQSAEECRALSESLQKIPRKKIKDYELKAELNKLDSMTAQGSKAKRIILTLGFPRAELCNVKELTVTAAAILGVEVGGQQTTCLFSNGLVKKYLGTQIGFAGGIGVKIDVGSESTASNLEENSMTASVATPYSTNEINPEAVVLVWNPREHDDPGKGAVLGLFAGVVTMETNLGFRFINGKRRWNYVLSILK